MTNLPELVTDRRAFLNLRDQCETIIDTQKRLPEFVFRRPFAKYFAIEHGQIHRKEFISFLSKIGHLSKDESVNYMTVDPDPENYYFRHCNFYGLASFRPSTVTERYLPVMSRNRQTADAFLARGGDVGAFWGSSLKWGIFCDRISWELALIAVSEDTEMPEISGLGPMETAAITGYMKGLYNFDHSKAAEFSQKLTTNYRL